MRVYIICFFHMIFMGSNYAVDYDHPVTKLSASSDALSKGTGLFEKGPLSIFDNDGTIQERLR